MAPVAARLGAVRREALSVERVGLRSGGLIMMLGGGGGRVAQKSCSRTNLPRCTGAVWLAFAENAQHAGLGEEASRGIELDSRVVGAGAALHAVVARQLGVHVAVGGAKSVLNSLLASKRGGRGTGGSLRDHRRMSSRKVGEDVGVFLDGVVLIEVEPEIVEVANTTSRAWDRPACASPGQRSSGGAELVFLGCVEQLSSGMLCQSRYERRDAISKRSSLTTVAAPTGGAPNSTR